jgi:hypothetical protein
MQQSSSQPTFTRREWLYVGLFIAVVLAVTALPYLYALRLAGANNQFMGIIFNIPDHYQYFSWMRESQTQILVPNQLTPETSTPLLFNLLWFMLGRIEAVTHIDYRILYQITRLLAGAFTMAAIYWFCGLVFTNRAKRWTAFAVAVLTSGLGWLLIVEKYLRHLPQANSPFAIYVAEPNTAYSIMAFPHFTIATGLITVIFGLLLLAQRNKSLRYSWAAAAVALFLSLQHAYDMFTIYGVIGMYALFIWIRDRRFPMFLFKTGLIVVLVSVWPALQSFIITNADAVWKGVLSQFDNAGAWTPRPWLLPILMGIAWLLAIFSIDIRTPWRDRDDTHLFLLAWFLSHFILIYIPLNFQIHLLSSWQVVIGVLATITLYRRVIPWLAKRFPNTSPRRLATIASVALVLAVVPTNLYLLAQRFLDLRRAASGEVVVNESGDSAGAEASHFFLSNGQWAAMKYLEGQVKSTDVVFASLDIGQFVPVLTGARTFLGHWAQTLNFFDKRDMVKQFFNPDTTDAERADILKQYNVGYVLYTPMEARLGAYDPTSASYLTKVFEEGDTKVYKVNPQVAAAGS